jgi:hypothetical protein
MQTLKRWRNAGFISRNAEYTHSFKESKLLRNRGPLDPILRNLITHGSLRVIDWHGASQTYGDGSGEKISIRIHDQATAWRLLFNPQYEAGESYMEGRLTIEEGSL